jgi:hypothetical protein
MSTTTMARTFVDDAAESRFREDGWLVLDWLDQDAATMLGALAAEVHPTAPPTPWTSDFYSEDAALKQRISDEMAAAFREPVARTFADHESFLHAFVVNWPGADGGVELHQHSTVVDETRFRAAVIWCALEDTRADTTGTLYVIPGSHHVQRGPKAERGPAWFDGRSQELVAEYGVEVSLRRGQALVFDNALLHGSGENPGGSPRRTAVANVAPRSADLLYHSWVGDGGIDVFRLDPRFFVDTVAVGGEWAPPVGLTPLGRCDADPWVPSDDEIRTLLGAPAPAERPARWWRRRRSTAAAETAHG